MESLPGLRPKNSSIEGPRAPGRDIGAPTADSGRFEERLKSVREKHPKMNDSSRAEHAAARRNEEPLTISGRAKAEVATEDSATPKPADQVSEGDAPESSPTPTASAKAVPAPTSDRSPAEFVPTPEPKLAAAIGNLVTEDFVGPAQAIEQSPGTAVPVPVTQPMPVAAAPIVAWLASTSAQEGTQPGAFAESNSPAEGVEIVSTEAKPAGALPLVVLTTSSVGGETAGNLALDSIARASLATTHTGDLASELGANLDVHDAKSLRAAQANSAREAAADILRQVRVSLSSDMREASIQLAPEALGRVWIRMRVEQGVLSADVRAETAQALRALELHAPELKVALAQHGVVPQSLAFSLQNSHTGDGPGRGHASNSRSPRASSASLALAPASVERALARQLSANGVDTYA